MRKILLNPVKSDSENSEEAPRQYPGAPLDSERAKNPPLPEPPYEPYKAPAQPGPRYEPYKGM
jgi:hypothetical protein